MQDLQLTCTVKTPCKILFCLYFPFFDFLFFYNFFKRKFSNKKVQRMQDHIYQLENAAFTARIIINKIKTSTFLFNLKIITRVLLFLCKLSKVFTHRTKLKNFHKKMFSHVEFDPFPCNQFPSIRQPHLPLEFFNDTWFGGKLFSTESPFSNNILIRK